MSNKNIRKSLIEILPKPFKIVLRRIRRINRVKVLKKEQPSISKSIIIKDLLKAGITKGDCVLLHSSLKSIGYVEGGPNAVIDALIEVITSSGTLVLPTYPVQGSMLKTCLNKDYVFNMERNTTTIGILPTAFLKYRDVIQSIHPTHSMSAIGKNAQTITECHHIGNKTYGEKSPWAEIIKLNGKILGVGISLAWHTIYHHVEDIMGKEFPINVKVDELYTIKCIDKAGNYHNVQVQPLNPIVAKTRIEKNPFILRYLTEIYENLELIQYCKIGQANTWVVDAKKFCDVLIQLAKLGITIYSTEEYIKEKKLYPFDKIKRYFIIEK
jgi:aminoglycoside 3-N-acetyltransferase